MSNMNFNCDVCGREVQGYTIVNGMIFCAKCYQETFGETDKDRKIADLQSQVAEKDTEIERLKLLLETERVVKKQEKKKLEKVKHDRERYKKTIEELKQQLAEKEKENNVLVFIIEEIEQFAWEQLNNDNFDKYKAYDEMYTKIKQLTKNSPYVKQHQDKISFAVEQLEKVKNIIKSKVEGIDKRLDDLNIKIVCESTSKQISTYEEIIEQIDQKINELKGKVGKC